jgi:hypothetical protein
MSEKVRAPSTSLAQNLAIQTQIHLSGTVGRLAKQIRDLEEIAPLFLKSNLVRSVPLPKPLSCNSRLTVPRSRGPRGGA